MTPRTPRRRAHLPPVHPDPNVLEQLAPEEEEVLVLSSFYGLAKDEIASVLGASVDAVDALFRSGCSHLRVLLAGRDGDLRAA